MYARALSAFIGFGPDLVALLSDETLLKDGGDQLAFTKLFLDEKRREKYGVRLDSMADILQHLDGVEGTGRGLKWATATIQYRR